MVLVCVQDKKAADGPPDVFAEVEAAVLPAVAKWKKDVFVASRVLYEGDEALCRAVEQAVWVSTCLSFQHMNIFIYAFMHCSVFMQQ